MSRLRQWLRAVFARRTLDREMRDEMQRHLDLATERLVARGMTAREARRAARLEFGNVTYMEEEGREARGAAWIESIARDLRYATRALRASPAFTIVAILSLAIGIGANTAIFSLIDAVMLKSLPVEKPAEIVQVSLHDPGSPKDSRGLYFTNPLWEALRDQAGSLAGYAVSGNTSFNLATGGERRGADALWVNGDFFRTLGVRPALGRLFTSADDHRGCAGAVVLSYGFWQSEFGGRSDVTAQSITLDGIRFPVIGVAPDGFFGVDVGQTNQVYVPICSEALMNSSSRLDGRRQWWLRVLARPRSGLSMAEYNARLAVASRGAFEATVAPQYEPKRRAEYLAKQLEAIPAGNGMSSVRRQYSKALYTLMGMVGIILLISCANVANLLLARGAARGREVAIRIAIGASRARLIRQYMTESLLLAAIGSAVGVGVAAWGSRALVAMMATGRSPVELDLALDPRVLGFTAAVGVITVVVFGLVPAWQSTRVDPQSAMKAGGRGTSDGPSRFRVGKMLVIAQSALALVLVVGAGLLVTTFRHLATTNPGFVADGVLITRFDFEQLKLTDAQYRDLDARVLRELRQVPGVRAVSTADMSPVNGSQWDENVAVDGFAPAKPSDADSYFNEVRSDYFKAMQTRLLAGRDFNDDDTPTSPMVAIVNKTFGDRFFHGASAVGKTYQTVSDGKRSPPVTIVGVVEDTKYGSMRETPVPIVYLAAMQRAGGEGSLSYIVSVAGAPTAVIGSIKSVAAGVDRRVSLNFRALSDQISQSIQRERVLASLSGFFGGVALVLAMIGLYGVMAYTVARRRVEIGIRIALGAVRGRVVRLVLGDVALMIAIGIAIGGAGAFAATRLLKTFLFGVTPTDPTTLIVAAVVLAAAALLAGAIPAGRAARLEPVEALRED